MIKSSLTLRSSFFVLLVEKERKNSQPGRAVGAVGAERELLCRAKAGLEVRVTEHWLGKQLGLTDGQNSCSHSSATGIKSVATPC